MRVVIAEDLFLLRDGLTRMLEAHGLEITAAVDNGTDLLAALTSDQPDVALVDVRLPPSYTGEGLRAALAARREMLGAAGAGAVAVRRAAVRPRAAGGGTGVVGYLLKDRVFDSAQFVEAVRRVAADGTAMDPEVISRLLARSSGDGALSALSPREGRGARADGRGPLQRRHRPAAGDHRARCGQAHRVDLPQLGPQPSDDDNRRVLAYLGG